MRILYSHQTRAADGQRVHIEGLTAALSDLGHEVRLCGPSTSKAPPPHDAMRRPTRRKGGVLRDLAEWGYGLRGIQRLRQAAKLFTPDIVYERHALFLEAGRAVAKAHGVPLLLEVNAPLAQERRQEGQLRLRGLAERAEHRVWRAADAVLPVSEVLAQEIEAAGVPRSRIHVLPNGVAPAQLKISDGTAARKRYGLGNGVVVGFVGFVRPWHGVDLVLDWMATPGGHSATLVIVGDGPAIPQLQAKAAALNLSERMVVTGAVPQGEVTSLIASFDIALQPASTPYASPLKLQEYMAQARAIVAPDQPNIREVLTDGANALLVPPGDEGALFQAMDGLMAQPDLRARLGHAARQTVIDRDLTWAGNARRVSEIAAHLLAERRESGHQSVAEPR